MKLHLVEHNILVPEDQADALKVSLQHKVIQKVGGY